MRISKRDTMTEIFINLSDGNIGAISAMSELNEFLHEIYLPHTLMYYLLILDLIGLYGSGIHVLYNDKCGRHPVRFAKLLIAADKKIISHEYLTELSNDELNKLNISDDQRELIHKCVLPLSNADKDYDRFVCPLLYD